MRKFIIAGNWKMHGSKSFVSDLLAELKNGLNTKPEVEVLLFPPFVYLALANEMLKNTQFSIGAQNCYSKLEGPYTGEISPAMLKDLGCDYVLLGHSERRHLFGESNAMIAKKFLAAGEVGLKPVLCVGETQKEREAGQTFASLREQLAVIFECEGVVEILQEAVIAYEPVWAIGTGLTATPTEAQEVHSFIRQELRKVNKPLAEKLRILYGGSVKQNNALDLFNMPDIDGGLIGGASLSANEFLEIIKSCSQ